MEAQAVCVSVTAEEEQRISLLRLGDVFVRSSKRNFELAVLSYARAHIDAGQKRFHGRRLLEQVLHQRSLGSLNGCRSHGLCSGAHQVTEALLRLFARRATRRHRAPEERQRLERLGRGLKDPRPPCMHASASSAQLKTCGSSSKVVGLGR